jgi:hypothetical protein
LDGETDWKLRKAIKTTQNYIVEGGSVRALLEWNANVRSAEPIENIYQYIGVFSY